MMRAERQVDLQEGLLRRVPDHLADPAAAQRIIKWLRRELHADVRLVPPSEVALPAADNHCAVEPRMSAGGTVDVPVQPGTADEMVLVVVSPTPIDSASAQVIRHAARLLGLIRQAEQTHQLAVATRRNAKADAFQRLMLGDASGAQRVLGIHQPGILDKEYVRVSIIDCPLSRCETMRRCEDVLGDSAMVTECQGAPEHTLVVETTSSPDHESGVVTELREVVSNLAGDVRRADGGEDGAARTLMSSSRWFRLPRMSRAYLQAYRNLPMAPYACDGVLVADPTTAPALADELDPDAALVWASHHLAAIRYNQILKDTIELTLSRPLDEAARILKVHPNTLRPNRWHAAQRLLPGDLDSLSYQVTLLLAFDIVPADPDQWIMPKEGAQPPTLRELLSAQSVREWAEAFVEPLVGHRQLLQTATVWLECGAVATVAARELGVVAATVHNRLVRVEDLLRQKLPSDAGGVRQLALALYVLDGRPDLDAATAV